MKWSTGSEAVQIAESDLSSVLSTGPFHAALRAAVRARGLTLERLRSHLGRRGVAVGISSLSDWQHGRSRPGPGSLPAVYALEQVLGLRADSLVRLLVAPDPEGAERTGRRRDSLDERTDVVAELLHGLPSGGQRNLDVLNRHDKVTIDASRRASVVWSRVIVRAREDGVDRFVLRYFGDAGCDVESVQLGLLENCRLGAVRRHATGVIVAELLFDEVLSADQTWVFEKQIIDETGRPCTEHAHGFLRTEEQYVLEVRFDPARLPVDCHVFGQPGLHDERRRIADLTLNRYHSVHLHASAISAGLIGIGWSWP
jgi:transcriptional regulator with XRE-family HTH domain